MSAEKPKPILLSWEYFFMGVACHTAKLSPDPHTQVGAVIVNRDKRIIGTGFNDRLYESSPSEHLTGDKKYHHISYAIPTAILGHSYGQLQGSTLYVTHIPSFQCAQLIIQTGIKEVCYLSDKYSSNSQPLKREDAEGEGTGEDDPVKKRIKREQGEAEATKIMLSGVSTRKLPIDEERKQLKISFRDIETEREGLLKKLGLPSSQPYPESGEFEDLKFEEHFMSLAFLASRRSRDEFTQVGAVIVTHSQELISTGYNGMPSGHDLLPWAKKGERMADKKDKYVCHAELNAIVNATKSDFNKCRMYVCMFPCLPCTKLIIKSGLKEFVYFTDKNTIKRKDDFNKTEELLKGAGVKYRHYSGNTDELEINFFGFLSAIEKKQGSAYRYF